MKRVSLLIFSYNDNQYLQKAIASIMHSVDEVIIIDASTNEKLKAKAQDKKIKIYRTPAFGGCEIVFNYGLSKCTKDWVLLLYSKETASPGLKVHLRELTEDRGYNAYTINRVEYNKNGELLFLANRDGWVRLFKRDKASKQGWGVIGMDIEGNVGHLQDPYRIDHISDYENILNGKAEYANMENYMILERLERRMNYRMLIEKSQNKVVRFILSASLLSQNPNKELDWLDYQLFFGLYHLSLLRHIRLEDFKAWRFSRNFDKIMIQQFFSKEANNSLELNMKIDCIKNGGPSRYLNIEDDEGMKQVKQRADKLKLSGARLTYQLMVERYMGN